MALNSNVSKDKKKRHRERKNPHAYDLYKQANHDQNARRLKQRWVSGNAEHDGCWIR